jgi:hypothetical protein
VPASLEAGGVWKAAGVKGGGWLVSTNWEGMRGVEYWSAGALVYWITGALVYWGDGEFVSWARAAAGKRIAAKRHKEHSRARPQSRTESWWDRIIEGAVLRKYLSA